MERSSGMTPKTRKAFLILAGVVAAVILAAVIFSLAFDMDRYKPRIEEAASAATGMKVRINGGLRLSLFPHLGVSLEEILIQNKGADVLSAKKAEVGIRLLPLLRRKIVIRRAGLIAPKFFITRDRSGRFNFETPGTRPSGKGLPAGQFEVGRIFIKNGQVLYRDERSGRESEAKECGLEIKDFVSAQGKPLYASSFEGFLSCAELKANGLKVSDLRVEMGAREGRFDADPITMKVFGGDGRGSIKGMMSGESPEYTVDFAVAKFRFEEVMGAFKQKVSMRGELDLKMHLAMKGKSPDEMKRTVQGEFSLRGEDLLHEGMDFDGVLEKYEKTQQVSLVDMGAFFVAGPFGPLLTKGYEAGSLYGASLGGRSAIRELVSDWKVKKGVAEAKDVAFSTRRNRIALKGRLDLVNERFDGVTVAVLDEKGCAKFSQKIYGGFRHPRVEKVSAMRSLVGPVLHLFKETRGLIKEEECGVFYAGSVKHPR